MQLWSNLSGKQAGRAWARVPIPGAEVGCRAPKVGPRRPRLLRSQPSGLAASRGQEPGSAKALPCDSACPRRPVQPQARARACLSAGDAAMGGGRAVARRSRLAPAPGSRGAGRRNLWIERGARGGKGARGGAAHVITLAASQLDRSVLPDPRPYPPPALATASRLLARAGAASPSLPEGRGANPTSEPPERSRLLQRQLNLRSGHGARFLDPSPGSLGTGESKG